MKTSARVRLWSFHEHGRLHGHGTDPASRHELVLAAAPAAAAQVQLVNAIRSSLGQRGGLTEPLGGAPGRDP